MSLTPEKALEKAIESAGGQTALAEICKTVKTPRGGAFKQGHIWKWLRIGRVPAEYVITIEKATDVKRYELRPDIYPQDEYQCICKGDDNGSKAA